MKIKETMQVYSYIIGDGFLLSWKSEYEKRFVFSLDFLLQAKTSPRIDGVNYAAVVVCENERGDDEFAFIYVDNTDEPPFVPFNSFGPFTHLYFPRTVLKEITDEHNN